MGPLIVFLAIMATLLFIMIKCGLLCIFMGHQSVLFVREYDKGKPGDELKYVYDGWYCKICGDDSYFCRPRKEGEFIGKECQCCKGRGMVKE